MPSGEIGRPIGTHNDSRHILVLIIIIDTTEKSSCSPSITCINNNFITCTHAYVRISRRIQACNRIFQPAVIIIFFLITSHHSKVVLICQWKHVIGIKIDTLVSCISIRTSKLPIGRYTQFRTCHLSHGHSILLIYIWSYIQRFILHIFLFISIIKENKPILDWLKLKSGSKIKAVILSVSICSAL